MTASNEIAKLLRNRCQLAIGSLALVEKQLLCILTALDDFDEKFHAEAQGGEKEKSDSDFFLTPPVSVYEDSL